MNVKRLKGALPDFGFKQLSSWLVVSLLIVLGTPYNTQAQQSELQRLTPAEEVIAERITAKVMQNLLREGVLDEVIARGIQRYVQKQRDDRAKTQSNSRKKSASRAKNVRRVSVDRDHIYGNPDATVSLIEYSDFECPFCKRFHPTAKRIVDAYDGQVNWVYRHFPLAFHNPGAQTQAEASECAASLGGNDAFWAFSNKIFERTTSNGNGFPIKNLIPLAVEIGLDESEFRRCLENGKFTARVKEDFNEGVRIGITGTPGNILLNNRSGDVIPKPGAVPYDSLKQAVDRLLNTAG